MRFRHSHLSKAPPPGWEDLGAALESTIPTQGTESDPDPDSAPGPGPGPVLDRNTAWDWSLALASRDIPHRTVRPGRGWRIFVPPGHLDAALAEVSELSGEDHARPAATPGPPPLPLGGTWPTLAVLALLVIFHLVTRMAWPGAGIYPHDWLRLGAADSTLILSGQWWRAMTALTLHSGLDHLAGNVLVGGVFIALACRELGSGTGWALILASGLAGNLANAAIHGPGHLSVGASTAVFGAVGLLGALRSARERHMDLRRTLAPVAAGLAILSMLGAGGENTDLGAHALGFAAGLVLGAGAGYGINRLGPPAKTISAALGLVSALGMAWAWLAAWAA